MNSSYVLRMQLKVIERKNHRKETQQKRAKQHTYLLYDYELAGKY